MERLLVLGTRNKQESNAMLPFHGASICLPPSSASRAVMRAVFAPNHYAREKPVTQHRFADSSKQPNKPSSFDTVATDGAVSMCINAFLAGSMYYPVGWRGKMKLTFSRLRNHFKVNHQQQEIPSLIKQQ